MRNLAHVVTLLFATFFVATGLVGSVDSVTRGIAIAGSDPDTAGLPVVWDLVLAATPIFGLTVLLAVFVATVGRKWVLRLFPEADDREAPALADLYALGLRLLGILFLVEGVVTTVSALAALGLSALASDTELPLKFGLGGVSSGLLRFGVGAVLYWSAARVRARA
ncbi:MAG: hypothetical protein MJE66_20200 [Proteobacteria bacterium]|nr:hypothetical protein [Pseudomonadota bacterium]